MTVMGVRRDKAALSHLYGHPRLVRLTRMRLARPDGQTAFHHRPRIDGGAVSSALEAPRDHPITAPSYSERRSGMAKQLGLGRGRRASREQPEPNPRQRVNPNLDGDEDLSQRRPRPMRGGRRMRCIRIAAIITALWSAICAGYASCLTYANRVYVTGALTRQVFQARSTTKASLGGIPPRSTMYFDEF